MADVDSETPEFVISRAYAAPRALVWQDFAEAGSLARWWGAKGFVMTVVRQDFRPGGICLFSMMGQGFGGTLDRFPTYLDSVRKQEKPS